MPESMAGVHCGAVLGILMRSRVGSPNPWGFRSPGRLPARHQRQSKKAPPDPLPPGHSAAEGTLTSGGGWSLPRGTQAFGHPALHAKRGAQAGRHVAGVGRGFVSLPWAQGFLKAERQGHVQNDLPGLLWLDPTSCQVLLRGWAEGQTFRHG